MFQLHRGLFSATNSATISSSSSSSSSSSALQVRSFMAKLQLRALHNYPGTCLPSSSFGASDKCRKFAPIRCKDGRFCCSFRTKNSKIGKDFYSLRSFGDGSLFNLSLGFLNSFTPVYSFSYGSFSNGISCGLPSYGAFTRRFFSQKSLGNMGAQDGKSDGSTSPLQGSSKQLLRGSSKQRKQAKALAANGKTRGTGSSSSEEISYEASSEPLVGGGKDKNLAGSSVPTSPVSNDKVSKVKGKRKPRTKKSTKQDAADSSLLKADAAEEAKGSSRSKKPSVGKSEHDPASKSNVNGTPVKIADSSSSSTKLLSGRKSGKSSSKGQENLKNFIGKPESEIITSRLCIGNYVLFFFFLIRENL